MAKRAHPSRSARCRERILCVPVAGVSFGEEITKDFECLATEQVNADNVNLNILSPLEAETLMNKINRQSAEVVDGVLPEISKAVERIAERMKSGGRLIYMGKERMREFFAEGFYEIFTYCGFTFWKARAWV